ncbi:hypothetical protein PACTADRAFT_1338 [Pachysolen tannophilus NRRL Y-2460]|uniref:Homeobox domain-containing protein n=1 Tax=Pachysolen tannophilus NRRL Y-2460 TaxID=669874 RepID=A0A1E4TYB4_PACTA|nr:hypothetical protein PACTADRAFT_1338 [Pachysolen tannophilus NRRL Y-2460]
MSSSPQTQTMNNHSKSFHSFAATQSRINTSKNIRTLPPLSELLNHQNLHHRELKRSKSLPNSEQSVTSPARSYTTTDLIAHKLSPTESANTNRLTSFRLPSIDSLTSSIKVEKNSELMLAVSKTQQGDENQSIGTPPTPVKQQPQINENKNASNNNNSSGNKSITKQTDKRSFAFISHSPATFPSHEPSIDNAQLARRKRRRTSPNELSVLQQEFEIGHTPNRARRQVIASKVNMTEKAVQIWFQNKRQAIRKQKSSQTSTIMLPEKSELLGNSSDSTSPISSHSLQNTPTKFQMMTYNTNGNMTNSDNFATSPLVSSSPGFNGQAKAELTSYASNDCSSTLKRSSSKQEIESSPQNFESSQEAHDPKKYQPLPAQATWTVFTPAKYFPATPVRQLHTPANEISGTTMTFKLNKGVDNHHHAHHYSNKSTSASAIPSINNLTNNMLLPTPNQSCITNTPYSSSSVICHKTHSAADQTPTRTIIKPESNENVLKEELNDKSKNFQNNKVKFLTPFNSQSLSSSPSKIATTTKTSFANSGVTVVQTCAVFPKEQVNKKVLSDKNEQVPSSITKTTTIKKKGRGEDECIENLLSLRTGNWS